MELTLVANFLRPFVWLNRLTHFEPRVGITRTPRGWTPGVVLRHTFTWGSPPSRRSSHLEYPTPVGPFRQRSQFFRRQSILFYPGRRLPRTRPMRVRSPYLGFQSRLSPTPPRFGVGELPPRNFNTHWNFWSGPRKGPTRRGISPSFRGFLLATHSLLTRQRKRRRFHTFLEGVPQVKSFFRRSYLIGLNSLLTRFQIQKVTPFTQPLRTTANRSNLTCSRGQPPIWSYYLTPPLLSRVEVFPAGRPLLPSRRREGKRGRPAGFFPHRHRRRRLGCVKGKPSFSSSTTPILPLRNEGIKQLVESTASFLAVKYHYRHQRYNRSIRLRRRNQLETRLSRRGWYFRRPCPRGREQPFLGSEEIWVPYRRFQQRRVNRRTKKDLRYRKRQRTNRIRRQRRKRIKWVPRRIWRLFRRFARSQPNRRFRHRGGVLGLSRRAAFSFARRLLPWRGPHWWRRAKQKKLRPRVRTPRRNRISLVRQRRSRLIKRASWRGTRLITRARGSVRGYLRQRRFQLGTPKRRSYRSKPRRGRIAQTVSRVSFSSFSISLENHLTRWRGLFTKGGSPRGGEQLIRQISRLSPQDQILRLYRLFYTPLGARTRRKGGALVKVPSLLKSSQAWNLVRRWFTRGVEVRGDRTWSARAIYEVMDPVRTGRAREDFLRAALLNSALL